MASSQTVNGWKHACRSIQRTTTCRKMKISGKKLTKKYNLKQQRSRYDWIPLCRGFLHLSCQINSCACGWFFSHFSVITPPGTFRLPLVHSFDQYKNCTIVYFVCMWFLCFRVPFFVVVVFVITIAKWDPRLGHTAASSAAPLCPSVRLS